MLHAQRLPGARERQSVANALHAAEKTCDRRGVQLTPIRRAVLEALWQVDQPIGAYELIRKLETRLGRKLAPPTVYRVLDFLLEQKFIARIETRNAFIPCAHPDHEHTCVFFICEACGSSAEVENDKVEALFNIDAAALGFRIGKRVIEMQGMCANCLTASGAAT
ncbi:Fur family transcriptional regulator [Rhodopseudomonas palustris]|nr:Fur family transcriptional regulator [Rhodopseudomonas palustris]